MAYQEQAMPLRPNLVAKVFVFTLLCCGAARSQQPTIDKVDPPDWFATLPSPMLLLHGTGLQGATVTGAPVTRTITAPNGHWAMVWLDTHTLPASTLHLAAHTPAGIAAFDYTLAPALAANDGIAGFSPADVMVCIMPDRFADGDPGNDNIPGSPPANRADPHAYHGGDLKGILDHLDYLQGLGITAVWLTPIVANNPKGTDYHGYGATDLYAVDPRLGTLADYRKLAAELHKRRMKLLFDDVPNHVGQAHPWAADSPLPDWFHGTAASHIEATYDFGKILDPHLPADAANAELNGWFVNTLPDLNQGNPVVAQYLLENMTWWIEQTGLDALRIDTFPFVQRTFWQGYLGALHRQYPHLNEVGEVDNGDSSIAAYFAGGRAPAGVDTHLHTPFDYAYFYSVRDTLLNGKPFSRLEQTLQQDWLYPHPERLVTILDNHDQARFMSEPNSTPALLRLATGITLTVRGTPQLYIGDEVLMPGGADPDNRRDFPGGWPGDTTSAFTGTGLTADQRTLHDFTAALGLLRAKTPALHGSTQQDVLVGTDTFAYVRLPQNARAACSPGVSIPSVLIAVNKATQPATLTIPTTGNALQGCTRVTQIFGDPSPANGFTLTMPPLGFAVFRVQ